jgi:hypothetical protein
LESILIKVLAEQFHINAGEKAQWVIEDPVEKSYSKETAGGNKLYNNEPKVEIHDEKEERENNNRDVDPLFLPAVTIETLAFWGLLVILL